MDHDELENRRDERELISHIVFDIGGVFFHEPRDERVFYEESEHKRLWDAYKVGGLTEREYWEARAEAMGQPCDNWQSVQIFFEKRIVLDTKLVTLANELKGSYQIHALSNAGAELERRLRTFEIDSLFEHVVNSHFVRLAKPDTAIYELTSRIIGAEPQSILFVDDKPRNTEAASELGFVTHVYESADILKSYLSEVLA